MDDVVHVRSYTCVDEVAERGEIWREEEQDVHQPVPSVLREEEKDGGPFETQEYGGCENFCGVHAVFLCLIFNDYRMVWLTLTHVSLGLPQLCGRPVSLVFYMQYRLE